MSDDKTSLRELIFLMRARQARLPYTQDDADVVSEHELDCDDLDCLPWAHKRSECVRHRLERWVRSLPDSNTPVA